MDYLAKPKDRIKRALLNGQVLTTAQANRMANTVDARKIISRLRKDGLSIRDEWQFRKDEDGKTVLRFKKYFISEDQLTVRRRGFIGMLHRVFNSKKIA